MRVVLLTTIWKRPELAQAVLEHSAAIRVPGIEIEVIAVWSPEDHMPEVEGVTLVRYPNIPVSDKWNAGTRAARRMDPDAVMIFGSDDFLHPRLIELTCAEIKAGADYVMPKELYFYDIPSGDAFYAKLIGKCGGGRTFSRALLDRVGWCPWYSGRSYNTDGAIDIVMETTRGHRDPDATINEPLLLACKSEQNEHSYEKMRGPLYSGPADGDELLNRFCPLHAKRIKKWRTARKVATGVASPV